MAGLASVTVWLLAFGLFGLEAVAWAKTGEYEVIPIAVLLLWSDWFASPDDWLGLHKVAAFLAGLPLWLALGITAFVLWPGEDTPEE